MLELVISQSPQSAPEPLRAQNFHKGLDGLIKKGGLVKNHVKPLLSDRDEGKPEKF